MTTYKISTDVSLKVAHALPSDGKALDLGSGTGSMLLALRDIQPTAELYGLEVNDKMVETSRRKTAGKNINIIQGSLAERLPFEDSSVDVVASTLVFHHLSEEVKSHTLREIERILKPKGELVLTDFSSPSSFHGSLIQRALHAVLREPEVAKQLEGSLAKQLGPIYKRGGNVKDVQDYFWRTIHTYICNFPPKEPNTVHAQAA